MPFISDEEEARALSDRFTLILLEQLAKRDREWERALRKGDHVVQHPMKPRVPKRFEA